MFSEIQRSHWFKDLSPPWEGIAGIIGWTTSQPDTAFMLGWMELAVHRARARRQRSPPRSGCGRPGASWMIGQLAAHREHRLRDERAALQPGPVRHLAWAALIADRWRVGRMGAGRRVGRVDGATSPGASRPGCGRSDPRTTKCPEGTAATVEVISDRPTAPSGPDDHASAADAANQARLSTKSDTIDRVIHSQSATTRTLDDP